MVLPTLDKRKKAPTPVHQTIYFYSKTDTYIYHILYQEYSPTTNIDQILQKRERSDNGKTIYARDEQGNVVYGIEKKGVPLSDVWDIPYLNPKAKERTGYPTQKPVVLLERIIQLCTNTDDWILDLFCGSGTTLVAATIYKRNAVGIDISEDALAITRKRLEKPIRTESRVLQSGRDTYQPEFGISSICFARPDGKSEKSFCSNSSSLGHLSRKRIYSTKYGAF